MSEHCVSSTRLKIAIIGDGVLGLVASIALRQSGHEVHIYPSVTTENDYCGVIHIPPNANSVLQQLGVSHDIRGGSVLEKFHYLTSGGDDIDEINLCDRSRSWQKPWLITKSSSLISHLKDTAQSAGPGSPVYFHRDGPATYIDEENAIMSFDNGKTMTFDLIIDEKEATFISHNVRKSNLDCRPTQAVLHLSTSWVASECQVFTSGDGRVVAVNKSLNGSDITFIGFALEHQSHNLRKSLRQQLGNFSQAIQDALLDPSSGDISTYTFRLDDLSILPCDIQYAAVLIEHGASIGVMLRHINSKDQVRKRLELHAKTSTERTIKTTKLSRKLWDGLQCGILHTHEIYLAFNHDEIHHSTQALRQWTWDTAPRLSWRQPVGFGPMTSPRQSITRRCFSNPREDRLGEAMSLTAAIRFRTSATLLRNIFPRETYSFMKPDTVAEASYVFQRIQNLSWLGGGGYNLALFQIHGVQHTSDIDGQVRKGSYVALVLEDLTDPILSGREDLGWPKVYSEIDVKDGTESGGDFSVSMSWKGTQWASLTWSKLEPFQEPANPTADSPVENIFVHKYIPATVSMPCRNAADADYDVMMPPPSPVARPIKWNYTAAQAHISISRGSEESLPTLWHICERLAELPVFEVIDAKIGRKPGQDDFSGAMRV